MPDPSVIVAASSAADASRLRLACGDGIVVAAAAVGTDDLLHAIATTRADVIVIQARIRNGATLVEALRQRAPDVALLWAGPDAPAAAHHAIAWNDALEETLPGAITKALLAR